jgi:hypothetical protein
LARHWPRRALSTRGPEHRSVFYLSDLEHERDNYKMQLELANKEIEYLKEKLDLKDHIIYAKDETSPRYGAALKDLINLPYPCRHRGGLALLLMQRLLLLLLAGVLPLLAQAQETISPSAKNIALGISPMPLWIKILSLAFLFLVCAIAAARSRKSNP